MRLLALKIETQYFDKILRGEKTVEYRRRYRAELIEAVETVILIKKVAFPEIAFATLSEIKLIQLKEIPFPEQKDLRKYYDDYYKNIHDNSLLHALYLKNVKLLN